VRAISQLYETRFGSIEDEFRNRLPNILQRMCDQTLDTAYDANRILSST
jgi:hypothetical protein